MIGALLFTWLQGADFYQDLHKKAVDYLPDGRGKRWVDLGCGPGLLCRLAAAKNYAVLGIDANSSMIRMAQAIALYELKFGEGSTAKFEVGDLSLIDGHKVHVASAASLLAVVADQIGTLKALWDCVENGGKLLIIEPTQRMNTKNAIELIDAGLPKKRVNGLRFWAKARENRALDPNIFQNIDPIDERSHDLLGGLVKAWIFTKGEGH